MTATDVRQEQITYESTLREVATSSGVLRYHEAGSGPPLVLLHGSGAGVSGWRNFRGNLGYFAQNFRTLALEFPGFGVSDSTGEHPMLSAPASAIRFLDALGIEQADFIGNSLGGQVATRIAIDYPERVRRLVTIGGVGRNLYSPMPGEGIKLLVDFTEDPTRERLIQWLEAMVYDPAVLTEELIDERFAVATDADTLASARLMYGRHTIALILASVESADAPDWTQLGKIKAPTLLTWGRDDRVTPLDSSILPMRTIPKAELHVFPNCGHWVMVEAKAAWESAVMAFLTRPDQA